MLFFYKANCGIMCLSDAVVPKHNENSRITRSVDPNSINFQVMKCKTSTYQQTYTIRTTRIWNILPGSITDKSNSLITFKNLLIKYYYTALDRNYNVDDPRSWKTICLKCNQARDLTKPIACCFKLDMYLYIYIYIYVCLSVCVCLCNTVLVRLRFGITVIGLKLL
jgi:hypothetical protein